MNAELSIVLKSDLCAASGDGFSSGIDVDVCLDAYGLPIIPGRRLKGCLREAAVDIGAEPSRIDAIFGRLRAASSGSLHVGNAQLPDAPELHELIQSSRYSANQVTPVFTQIRAQTAIENDTVAEGSLRFIRVVKRLHPISGNELAFIAPLSIADEFIPDIQRIAKAMRNIGYRRNRGLGAVRCRVAPVERERNGRVTHFPGGFAYAVRLDEPLMASRQGFDSSDFVPGSSVRGYFASRLAQDLDAATFEQAFLCDAVSFSPLYPVAPSGNRAIPAFGLLAKIKGSQQGDRDGAVVNLAYPHLQLRDSEQPKPLKDGFLDPMTLDAVETQREVVYHHATGRATGDEPTLYTQECLSACQVFAGYVSGPDDLLGYFEEVLETQAITFGRSKTAQYSHCSLVDYTGDMTGRRTLPVEQGEMIVALLDSDTLLADGRAGYTNDPLRLAAAIATASDGALNPKPSALSNMKYRVLSGYNAKWNQKKPQLRAFAAGTYLMLQSVGTQVPSEVHVGEYTADGLGRVLLLPAQSLVPNESNVQQTGSARRKSERHFSDEDRRAWTVVFEREAQVQELRRVAIECAKRADLQKFTPSFVGRIMRMCEQATSAGNLDERIASVKNESKRRIAQHIVTDARNRLGKCPWCNERQCLETLFGLIRIRAKQYGDDSDD